MLTLRSTTQLAGIAALGAVLAFTPAQAKDESTCDCWFYGFEDGLEFPWADRQSSGAYQVCAKAGKIKYYEEGFTISLQRKDRTCPYSQ